MKKSKSSKSQAKWHDEFDQLCNQMPKYSDKEVMKMIKKCRKKSYEDRLKVAGITFPHKRQKPK